LQSVHSPVQRGAPGRHGARDVFSWRPS